MMLTRRRGIVIGAVILAAVAVLAVLFYLNAKDRFSLQTKAT